MKRFLIISTNSTKRHGEVEMFNRILTFYNVSDAFTPEELTKKVLKKCKGLASRGIFGSLPATELLVVEESIDSAYVDYVQNLGYHCPETHCGFGQSMFSDTLLRRAKDLHIDAVAAFFVTPKVKLFAEKLGVPVIGPSSYWSDKGRDKYYCRDMYSKLGIPTPPTELLKAGTSYLLEVGKIAKSRKGASGVNIFSFNKPTLIGKFPFDCVIQEKLVVKSSPSVQISIDEGVASLLTDTSQLIEDGKDYGGCIMPAIDLPESVRSQIRDCSLRVAQYLIKEGVKYARLGIDFIVTPEFEVFAVDCTLRLGGASAPYFLKNFLGCKYIEARQDYACKLPFEELWNIITVQRLDRNIILYRSQVEGTYSVLSAGDSLEECKNHFIQLERSLYSFA